MAHNLQQEHQQQVMDEMMEQILSMPSSWGESGAGRWDFSSISGLESMVALLNTNSGGGGLDPELVLNGSIPPQALKQEPEIDISGFNCGDGAHKSSKSSSSLGSYGLRAPGSSLNHLQEDASDSTWQQHQQQFGNVPGTLEELSEAQMLGKRLRDEQQQHQQQAVSLMENLSTISASAQDGGIFSSYGGAPVPRTSAPKPAAQAQVRTSGDSVQEAPAASAGAAATTTGRPRVRARRGQATDPHSIAERLRRERIAERMKSLQELVPNSNKTDKASMLDEIIDYVKFLQLQVKVLSMSRLGNAGAVMSDLPAEDSSRFLAALGQSGVSGAALQEGISLTERQVARLMEEDMGSAMQYLQSKGLCLMPIHLASNVSKSKSGAPSTSGAPKSSSANKSSSSSAVKNS